MQPPADGHSGLFCFLMRCWGLRGPRPSFSQQQTYSISDVAQALGVSTSYLRLAERLKLIPAARRTAGGHRRYTVKDVAELRLDGVGRKVKEQEEILERIAALEQSAETAKEDVEESRS